MGSTIRTPVMLRSTLSLVLLTGVAASTGGSDIDSIYSHLFSDGSGYNKNTIPLPTDGPVNLEIGLSLINMDLVMSATAWVWMRWTDYRLGWDPALFGGIEVIRVPGHVIWTPDIEVYNSADFGGSSFHDRMSRDTFLTLVYWNSTVLSVPAMPIEAICAEADISLPESSAQSCNVKIGSWTFDGHRIELTPYHSWGTRELLDHIDFSEMRNSAWVVTSQKDDVRKTNH